MADRDTPVCEDTHVEYRVSLHPFKSAGYQSKARNRGTVNYPRLKSWASSLIGS
jgi:hypothetical protein